MKLSLFFRMVCCPVMLVAGMLMMSSCEDEKTTGVSSVSLNKTETVILTGGSETLIPTITPDDAVNHSVRWSSDNSAIASVDDNGKVTGVSQGETTVTVTTLDGGRTATCRIIVTDEAIPVAAVELDEENLTLAEGEKHTFVATIKPSNAINRNVTWNSSKPAVASIDENGVMTALEEGNTIITVTTEDGGKTASCEVTVLTSRIPLEGIAISEVLGLKGGENFKLEVTYIPADATIRTVTWKTDDESIATVATDGTVTAVGDGTTTITATAQDGDFTASCEVTVIEHYVWFAGYESVGRNDNRAKAWVNGVLTYSSEVNSTATGIFVDGDDIYLSGTSESKIGYWKNDNFSVLSDNVLTSSNSVFVSDGNVYIAGMDRPEFTQTIPTVWKNGAATSYEKPGDEGEIYSIFVSGNDIYAAGSVIRERYHSATVWKNGEVLYALSDEEDAPTYAYQVVVSAGDVYTVGVEATEYWFKPLGTVWKNGEKLFVCEPDDIDRSTTTYCIAVDGSDVYVGGTSTTDMGSDRAVIWKNGEILYRVGTGWSNVRAISVVDGKVYAAGYHRNTDFIDVGRVWKDGETMFDLSGTENQTFLRGMVVK